MQICNPCSKTTRILWKTTKTNYEIDNTKSKLHTQKEENARSRNNGNTQTYCLCLVLPKFYLIVCNKKKYYQNMLIHTIFKKTTVSNKWQSLKNSNLNYRSSNLSLPASNSMNLMEKGLWRKRSLKV